MRDQIFQAAKTYKDTPFHWHNIKRSNLIAPLFPSSTSRQDEIIMTEMTAGSQYGRLTLIGRVVRVDEKDRRKAFWVCSCECGQTKTIAADRIKSGKTKSCGCYRKDSARVASTKHGMVESAERRSWKGMKDRCSRPGHKDYHNYGGRGIKVCVRWQESFAAFFEDMGNKPSPSHTIDRIDTDGDYEPGNCRWATPAEQSRNRRGIKMLTHDGKTQCITDWAKDSGIKYGTLLRRLKVGMPIERAIVR